jgi:hypothetical protein
LGCLSWVLILIFYPGSRSKKGTGSRIRNTDSFRLCHKNADPALPFSLSTLQFSPSVMPVNVSFSPLMTTLITFVYGNAKDQKPIGKSKSEHEFLNFKEPQYPFQGINSTRLYSLSGRFDNPIPTRFLVPIDLALLCKICKRIQYSGRRCSHLKF